MKKFINDVKKYYKYALYATKAELTSEVTNSYLNWLWWILDPLCFMLIYTFIVRIVFKSSEELYFSVFVFIGLSLWNFFNKSIVMSVRLINKNRMVISKVYLPKYILILIELFVNLFKLFISFGLIFVFMFFYKIPLTLNILWTIPIIIISFMLCFGIACLLMHFGVFVKDLANIINILMRLVFYLSGVFYSISGRLSEEIAKLVFLVNPISYLLSDIRNVMIYETSPHLGYLLFWFIISLVVDIIGIKVVQKYENSYIKVVR